MNTQNTYQSWYSIFANIRFFASLAIIVPIFFFFAYPIIYLPASWRFRSRWYYRSNSLLARALLFAAGIKLKIAGRELFDQATKEPSIIVLNHQSCIDAWVSEKLLGSQLRIMFSNDYSKIPLLGAMLRRMNIVVTRTTVRSSVEAINRAVNHAQTYGSHVVIFPEGTRHTDGNIHTFYRGFTILAEQLNRPIVPVFLHGFHKILPKGKCFFHTDTREVILRVGKSFHFDPSKETREEFLEKVHNWFTLESCRVNKDH